MPKRVVIVGAGPGGLAGAILRAGSGHDVTVVERLPHVGGRTSTLEIGGYRFAAARGPENRLPAVSVLIPARNEEAGIGSALEAACASRGVAFEVVVLDDRSDDRTAEVIAANARDDPRVRLLAGAEPPEGWCGKQYACAQ